MRSCWKLLILPAALALAGGAATANAAPGAAGATVPASLADTRLGGELTPVHHTYWHWRYQNRYWRHRHHYRPYRYYYRPYRYYRPYYYYRPRCYWSHYWHRTICR
jgi:hypothetical protein